MIFKEKKYTVIKKAISYELANFGYNYLLLKREAVAWMHQNNLFQNLHLGLVHGKINKFLIPILFIVICLWKP